MHIGQISYEVQFIQKFQIFFSFLICLPPLDPLLASPPTGSPTPHHPWKKTAPIYIYALWYNLKTILMLKTILAKFFVTKKLTSWNILILAEGIL